MPEDVLTLAIEGEAYTMDDLTFRERKEVRRLARELDGNPSADLDDIMVDDLIVAMVTVIKRRAHPEYSTDEAMDIRPSDIVPGEEPARPTRRKAGAVKSTP